MTATPGKIPFFTRITIYTILKLFLDNSTWFTFYNIGKVLNVTKVNTEKKRFKEYAQNLQKSTEGRKWEIVMN